MATIDINKLIQESMSTTLGKDGEVLNENAAGVPAADAPAADATDPNMDAIQESLFKKVKKSVAGMADDAKDKADDIGDKVKDAAGAAKDAIGDNPKVAGAAAGAAGLVGAGMLAKKYLKRGKK